MPTPDPAKGVGEPPGESLPSRSRLRRGADVQRVQNQGARFPSGALVMMLMPNALGVRRLGLTVSSRVGNSVVRSQVKRWLREIFRKRRGDLPESVDVVLIARSAAKGAGLERLTRDFEAACARARSEPGRGR